MKNVSLKKILIIAVVAIVLITAGVIIGGNNGKKDDAKKNGEDKVKVEKKAKIGLSQIVEHPSLNTIRDSFLEELKALGYDDKNSEVIITQANGEPTTLATIMQDYSAKQVDVIVPIATPTAMAAAQYAEKIPVVFSAISDPIGSKLTTSLEKPDRNITGTSDVVQVSKILDLAIELFPETKTVGFIYNSAEANSITNIKKAKDFCDTKGIKYEEVNVSNTSEVAQAAESILSKADIIFSPNDNTVAAGIASIANKAMEHKKPFFVGADSMVGDNGFATVGIDYVELGKETARMVDKVLKGTKVSDIPVKEFKENLNIYINEGVADKIGFKVPDSIKGKSNYKAIQLKK